MNKNKKMNDTMPNIFNQTDDVQLDELDDAPELIDRGNHDEYDSDSDSDDNENNKDQGAPGAPTEKKETGQRNQEEEQAWKKVPHRHNTIGNKRDFSHLSTCKERILKKSMFLMMPKHWSQWVPHKT